MDRRLQTLESTRERTTRMTLLSDDEAIRFVTKQLKIPEEDLLSTDRFALLCRIIVGFHENVPFQTLTNMALSPSERRIPLDEELKDEILNGRGGLCAPVTYFCHQLLTNLGYQATLAGGSVGIDCFDINHVAIIVRSLVQPDDIYVVEVAIGYATFRPVALNFDKECPVYEDSFQAYKYVRQSPTDFVRLHAVQSDNKKIARMPSDTSSIQWTHVYRFSIEPVDYQDLAVQVDATLYRNMKHKLNQSIRIVAWPRGRAVVVLNRSIYREDDDNNLQKTTLQSDEDLEAAILSEFPMFGASTVHNAVLHLKSICSQTSCS